MKVIKACARYETACFSLGGMHVDNMINAPIPRLHGYMLWVVLLLIWPHNYSITGLYINEDSLVHLALRYEQVICNCKKKF